MPKKATLQAKRFAIKQSLIGKNEVIEFKNLHGQVCIYDHDKVYEYFKDKFDEMPCFQKYKIYTNSANMPKFVRDLDKDIAEVIAK